MKRYKTVDAYINSLDQWHDEVVRLREILNSTEVEEAVKWGGPCYTYQGKNVVGLGAFKSYFALWFFQGALLADEPGVLINAQEGVTKALRQWRMSSKNQIKPRLIKQYVREAMTLVDSGQEIKPKQRKTVIVPPEMQQAFSRNKRAKNSFEKLTPGKQREYAEYIAEAKREETKQKRMEKILPMIQQQIGLNDKYRNC